MIPLRWIFLFALISGCGGNSNNLPTTGKSIDELIGMLRDSEPTTQAQGALGISQLGSRGAKAIPELLPLLTSKDQNVRQNAITALGKIGSDAKEAVPNLISLLSDREWTIRRQAVLALGEIGDQSARKPVEKLLKDPDGLVRKAATETMKKLKG
jgi:hypothetical protein